MKKPNGYDETQVGGEFTPVALGGHTAVVKKVLETESKTGKPMIKVAIDFDAKDAQPNYFADAFASDTRDDKKWPYQGTQYIMSEDAEGKCSRSLKSFITSVEDSNGSQCEWGDGFEKWFTGKKVGVVFGEVEEEYNGEIKTRRKIRWFCAYDRAKEQKVPDKKLLTGPRPAAATVGEFMSVPEGVNEEIPF